MSIELSRRAVSALEEARQSYVAVQAADSPHVTPTLYTWSNGALWFAAASSTLKARTLREHPFAGAVVSVRGTSVVLFGHARVLDPKIMLSRPLDLPGVTRATIRYTVRNAVDLVAFVRDVATGATGSRVPKWRVLCELAPSRAALVESDVVRETWGVWSFASAVAPQPTPVGGDAAVAAVPGPYAVPCRWYKESGTLHVPPSLVPMLGVTGRFPLSVVGDEYAAPGPAAKSGWLLQGHGELVDRNRGRISFDVRDAVTWDGIDIGGASVDAAVS